MRKAYKLLGCFFMFLCYQSMFANTIAVDANVGTQGPGLGGTYTFAPNWAVTIDGNYFDYDFNYKYDSQTEYKNKIKWRSADVILNYHPFAGVFHLNAGGVYNGNVVDGTLQYSGSEVCIDGTCYSSSDIGGLTTKITFNPVAPYLGFGWGHDSSADYAGLGCDFNIGAFYQGKPKLEVDPQYAPGIDPNTRAEIQHTIDQETSAIQDKLNKFQIYPVVKFTLYYRW